MRTMRCDAQSRRGDLDIQEMCGAFLIAIATGMGTDTLAMTMGLVTAGHDVTDRNAAALTELAKQAAGLKGRLQTVVADLPHPYSFAHVTGLTLITYGRIDALVNNAGIAIQVGAAIEFGRKLDI